jgi:hypothetical protein
MTQFVSEQNCRLFVAQKNFKTFHLENALSNAPLWIGSNAVAPHEGFTPDISRITIPTASFPNSDSGCKNRRHASVRSETH